MGLFDVHAHLTHPKFAHNLDALLERARAAGLTTIITNGLNPTDNQAVRELAARYPIIKPAYGLYPVDAVLAEMRAAGEEYPGTQESCSMNEAIGWVKAHAGEAFAIGEIGLDGYWVKEPFWKQQEDAFRQLVAIAQAADKPVIIHTRKRERRTLEILEEMKAPRVNWHCFGSRVKLARRITELGHYISIPANVRRSESFTRMVETLPKEQLLLETDCPYLGPEKDVTNEPANVLGTVQYMAELWKMSAPQVVDQLSVNFERLFHVAP